MPRATTAAWQVMPPRAVRIPWAACMPWMSSGLVSTRTRITLRPILAASSASSAVEDHLAAGGAGRGRQPLGDHFLVGLGIEGGVQQLVELRRLDAQHRLLLADQPFLHHVDGNLHRRPGGPLAVAGLQHVELALLDGELDILHVPVMVFEGLRIFISCS